MKRTLLAIALLAAAGLASAQAPPRRDLIVASNPIDSIEEMDLLYRSDDNEAANLHIEIVTNGIKINWIGKPHSLFVVKPRPDLYLPYIIKYHSYCRINPPVFDEGEWKRNAICVAERGGVIFFQSLHYSGGDWGRRIVLFKEVPK